MKRILIGMVSSAAILVIGLFALVTVPATADEGVIERRIELMRKDILGNFRVIIKFTKSDEGSMVDVEKAAKALQLAADQLLTLFPKGTGRPDVHEKKTRALAKIWDDWETFENANNSMSMYAGGVEIAAAKGDAEGVKKNFVMIGKEGCGGCHGPFRGPKAE